MAALEKLQASKDEADAHDLLVKECPWYQHVSEERSCTEPSDHCNFEDGFDEQVKLTPETPEASTVDKPTRPPGGPGLFHVKGLHLPPYFQHLWFHLVKEYGPHRAYGVAVGVVHKWAKGVNPGGWKRKDGSPSRVHSDVRSAAQRNIALWEKDRAKAHAQKAKDAAAHAGKDEVKASAVTAPGASKAFIPPAPGATYSQYGLHQQPAQTVSPSPPLPPAVPLPKASEVRAIVSKVPSSSDKGLEQSVRTFLETAAVKLEKDDELEALHALRSAQASVYSAHKQDLAVAMPAVYTASVFTHVVPAEQSSVQTAMLESRNKAQQWRAVEQSIGALIDRIRKRYFHGVINGPSANVRLAVENGLSALEKVLALTSAESKVRHSAHLK